MQTVMTTPGVGSHSKKNRWRTMDS